MKIFLNFTELNERKDNYQKALEYYRRYHRLNNEVAEENPSWKIANLYDKYLTAKKEKESQLDLMQEKLRHNTKKYRFYFIVSVLLNIAFIVFILLRKNPNR